MRQSSMAREHSLVRQYGPLRLMSAGVAGRPLDGCDLCISGCARSSGGSVALIAPEAAWRQDGDQFVEVEIEDRLKR